MRRFSTLLLLSFSILTFAQTDSEKNSIKAAVEKYSNALFGSSYDAKSFSDYDIRESGNFIVTHSFKATDKWGKKSTMTYHFELDNSFQVVRQWTEDALAANKKVLANFSDFETKFNDFEKELNKIFEIPSATMLGKAKADISSIMKDVPDKPTQKCEGICKKKGANEYYFEFDKSGNCNKITYLRRYKSSDEVLLNKFKSDLSMIANESGFGFSNYAKSYAVEYYRVNKNTQEKFVMGK